VTERARIVTYMRVEATRFAELGTREADPRLARLHHDRATWLRALASRVYAGVHDLAGIPDEITTDDNTTQPIEIPHEMEPPSE
jgi:hypothetical protein